MTRDDLYTLTTSLTSGVAIDTSLFDTFLDVAQMQLEGLRPWVILRTSNVSQSASPADTYQTAKTLATDFKEWWDEAPMQLLDVNNNPSYLWEVPFADRYLYQKTGQKFCVDYPNNVFYLLGNITQNYTILQNYIKIPTLVSSSASATWVFPERFHKILALMVAIFWRKGVDYDIFNQTLAGNQEQQVAAILDIMTRWDSNLQYSMQRGKDPFNAFSIGQGNTNGGNITF